LREPDDRRSLFWPTHKRAPQQREHTTMGAPRPALLIVNASTALILTACGPSAHQATPDSAPTTTPPAPPPPVVTPTPTVYPSIGDHLGDPHRIGPKDLQFAVDSAQSAVSDSRLISAQPASDHGRPVWNVRLLSGGPSLKLVEVDAVVRGAKATDVQAPPADLTRTVHTEDMVKTSWSDAVQLLQRRNPRSVASSVALDLNAPTPAWKITLLTGRKQTVYTVNAATGTLVSTLPGTRPQSDYR
jgi:hypothetical protein